MNRNVRSDSLFAVVLADDVDPGGVSIAYFAIVGVDHKALRRLADACTVIQRTNAQLQKTYQD